ncbi:MAG: beta-aspartyl-peptidase [Ahniella sp.]|nr:beta-aspartyl-peptidase [Ahniella sp.]
MSTDILLIRGAHVMAPEDIGIRDVLIACGRIIAIGDTIRPSGISFDTIDGRGRYLVPGLVDSLVHISGGGGEGGFATRTPPLIANAAFAAGVTTVIGALGTDDVTRNHADLLGTARALRSQGLSAYALTGSYRVPVRTLTGSVRDDLVLIPEFLGVGEVAVADHRGSQPTVAELARIGSDALAGGLLSGKSGTVLIHMGDHATGLAPLIAASSEFAVPIRQWLPTHINRQRRLLDEGVLWARQGGRVDLTTSTTPELIAAGDLPGAVALDVLFSAGIPSTQVSMSSDGQASLPVFDEHGRFKGLEIAPISSLIRDVQSAVRDFRWPLADVLATVTSTPAECWHLPQKGHIRVGADADLLLLDHDSLEITHTIAAGVSRDVFERRAVAQP